MSTDLLPPPTTLEPLPAPVTTPDPWAIESLLRGAFARLKSRYIPYIVTTIISSIIMAALVFAGIIVLALTVGILLAAQLTSTAIVLGTIMGLGLVLVLAYVGSWLQLAQVKVIISDSTDAMATIKSVRPIAYPYMIVSSLGGLFVAGLMPLGIVSLFIVPLIWSVLISYTHYVMLTRDDVRDTRALWISTDMYWGAFGKIVVRSVILSLLTSLVVGGVVAVVGLLTSLLGAGVTLETAKTSAEGPVTGAIQSLLSAGSEVVSYVSSYLVAPFTIAYHYEIFRLLPPVTTPKKRTGWIIVSALSGALVVALIIWVYASYLLPAAIDMVNSGKLKEIMSQIQNSNESLSK